MEANFPIGTLVLHRAAKQKMVVVAVLNDTSVRCHFRNEVTGRYEYEVFVQAELEAETPIPPDHPND